MKNKFLTTIVVIMAILGLAGCSSKFQTLFSYTYKVDTGDNVKIELDTSDGYSITSSVPFEISQNKEVLSVGTFIYGEYYDAYVKEVKANEDVKIITEASKNNIKYVFYNYNDKEYNYVILITDSKTGLLLENTTSEECAQEVFERLKITLQ